MSPDYIQTPFQSAGDPRPTYITHFREVGGWGAEWIPCAPHITAVDDADAIKHLQNTVDVNGREGMEYCLVRQPGSTPAPPNIFALAPKRDLSMPHEFVPGSLCCRTVPVWRWRIERRHRSDGDWCDLSDEDLPGMLTEEFEAGEHEALRRLRAARLTRENAQMRLVRRPLEPDFEPFEEPPPEPWANR